VGKASGGQRDKSLWNPLWGTPNSGYLGMRASPTATNDHSDMPHSVSPRPHRPRRNRATVRLAGSALEKRVIRQAVMASIGNR